MNLTIEQVKSAFTVAGFKVLNHWELMNQYWPRAYTRDVVDNPWFLVKTKFGLITIGPRKRVIEISWEDTGVEVIVTEDDVTKNEHLVHAYSLMDATRYLSALHEKFVSESKVVKSEIGWTRWFAKEVAEQKPWGHSGPGDLALSVDVMFNDGSTSSGDIGEFHWTKTPDQKNFIVAYKFKDV